MASEEMSAPLELSDRVDEVLESLTFREREVIKLLYGLGDGYTYTQEEVGRIFKTTARNISAVASQAIRKLQDPVRARKLSEALKKEELGIEELLWLQALGIDPGMPLQPELEEKEILFVQETVEKVSSISVDLMAHLKGHAEDIQKIPWPVFEEMVAECLASRGFEKVRLVGQNSKTAADVFAIEHSEASGVRLRYFVEAKRWKKKVGVEVIDRVIGAIASEREWGWHLGMIVSIGGFTEMQKYTRHQLDLMGIALKDKDDVVSWLNDYRPSDKGLWLPSDFKIHTASPADLHEKP